MASTLTVGDVLRVQGICTMGVQTALNTAHYVVSNVTGGGLTDTQLAVEFDQLVSGPYKAWLPTQAAYFGVLVQRIFPVPQYAHQIGNAGAGPGTGGGGALPGEVSGLAALRTNFAGRAFRGRLFIPFPAGNSVAAGPIPLALSPAALTLMGEIVGNLAQSVTFAVGGASISLTCVVFHRKANKAGTTTPNGVTPITSFALETLLADQRRRSARGRANPPPV